MVMPVLFLFLLLLLISQMNSQNIFPEEKTLLNSITQHWNNRPLLNSWTSCDSKELECDSTGKIISLTLSDKNINGTIPLQICLLRNLVKIDLSRNKISGEIPGCLYNCSNLQVLDLSMNLLSGKIPGELFLMQKLQSLILNGNKLFGEMPTRVEAYSLVHIDLSDNRLNGSIPDGIRNLTNLVYLDLSLTSLNGLIPVMHRLSYMSLSRNNFTGEIPAELGLFSLSGLNLSHNRFHGVVPKLPSLDFLDLSYNQLSGDVVHTVFGFSLRGALEICSNKFLGRIPYEFVNKTFQEHCVDRSNLCAGDGAKEDLPHCPLNLCSDYRFQHFMNCNTKPHKKSVAVIAVAIGCGVVGLVIFGYLARKCWKIAEAAMALNDEDKEWEMISFQELDFSKFDILSGLTEDNLIGSGGSGKVYRVVIKQTGNTVAVKSIWNDRKSDERLQKEFMAEIQTLANIRHNNIVKLICFISGKNVQLLVYQYFENKSLDQWLHDEKREISPSDNRSITKLDWPVRLHIAIGVAQGLSYMHHDCSPPIIHRDIKSSNILLDSGFNAILADFGLAKMLSTSGDTETATVVAGTFGYIAPEYACTKRVNVKSDVYSFGVVLLELTTGRKAVSRDDHMNLAGWAQRQYRETRYIVDLLDSDTKESSFVDQIVAVLSLGILCTNETSSNRPSMRNCLHILQNCTNSCVSSSNPLVT